MSFWRSLFSIGRAEVETSAWYRTVEIWRDRCFKAERREEEWRSRALDAECRLEKLHAERMKLDRRIHNQRRALRENWEIVEMRGNYMGSPASRAAYARLFRRHQDLKSTLRELEIPLTSSQR